MQRRQTRSAAGRTLAHAFLVFVGLLGAPARALPAQTPPAPESAAAGGSDSANPAPPSFARVEVDQQPVRCFDSENSPVYLDQLARGDVVQIGEERNGFVAVTLPLGVTGYVHKKFATPPDEAGFVRTSGKRVSFRYRPRSTEAPADSLDDGVTLHFMAEENDWYAVRNPRTVGYVPRTALVTDVDPAVAAAAWSRLEETRRAQWQKVTSDRVEASKRAAALAVQRRQLEEVVGKFRAEMSKPWNQQRKESYTALEASLSKLAAGFDAGSTEQLTATSLGQEIRKQVLVLDAQMVAAETLPPPKLEVTVKTPAVEDPLARFDLVGWLQVARSGPQSRAVRLMRGGRVLGYLTCSSERYDFKIFDGAEVGVLGPKEAGADGTWLLDVQRLEILGIDTR
jgi:hypothetical protein